jgi:hypothetical protein
MFHKTAVAQIVSPPTFKPLWWKLLLESSTCRACTFSLNPADLLPQVEETSLPRPIEGLWDHYLDAHATDDFHYLVPPNRFAAMILGLVGERKRNWERIRNQSASANTAMDLCVPTPEAPLLDLVMVHNTSAYELQVVEDELFPTPESGRGLKEGTQRRPHGAPWSVAILWTPHFRQREVMEHWKAVYNDKLLQEQERYLERGLTQPPYLPLPLVAPPYGEASLEPMGYSCLDVLSRIQFHLCSSYAMEGCLNREASAGNETVSTGKDSSSSHYLWKRPTSLRVGLITPDRALTRDAVRFFGGPSLRSPLSTTAPHPQPSSPRLDEVPLSLGSELRLQIYPIELPSKEWCRNWTPKSSS